MQKMKRTTLFILSACAVFSVSAHATGAPLKSAAKPASQLSAAPGAASIQAQDLPELDLHLRYYSKSLSTEGVLREARYEEKLMRRIEGRAQHLWQSRILPPGAEHAEHEKDPHAHKHFNPVLSARHLVLEDGRMRLEYINQAAKEVVATPPGEYDNVNFDGSWGRAAYLIEPEVLAKLPLLQRAAPAGAEWRERKANGQFLRVLWDKQRKIALQLEQGDIAGRNLLRIEVSPAATLSQNRPWRNVQGYTQKEYADYLD